MAKKSKVKIDSHANGTGWSLTVAILGVAVGTALTYYMWIRGLDFKVAEQARQIHDLQDANTSYSASINDMKRTIGNIKFVSDDQRFIKLNDLGMYTDRRHELPDGYVSYADGKFYIRPMLSLSKWEHNKRNLWDVLMFKDLALKETDSQDNYLASVTCDSWNQECPGMAYTSYVLVVSLDKMHAADILKGFNKHISYLRALNDIKTDNVDQTTILKIIDRIAKNYEKSYIQLVADTEKIDVPLSVFISLIQQEILITTKFSGQYKMLSIERNRDVLYCKTMMEYDTIGVKSKVPVKVKVNVINQMAIVNTSGGCTLIRTMHITYKDSSNNYISVPCEQAHIVDDEFFKNIKVALDK